MAVTQISRIQHRRGLEQDLPQLSSAELGWSVDTQKLYIGNGTLEEGAPHTGVTEILTVNSVTNIASLLGTYTFVGDVAGYAAQTGSSTINPTTRSYQQKLDDFVNIKDFGAKGNGIDDDSAAINRALQQIYKTGVTEIDPRTRRTIYFPAGNYLVNNTILIPPFARLVGDGIYNTTILTRFPGSPVAVLCDSAFQIGAALGTNSAILPSAIDIVDMQFSNASNGVTFPVFVIDSAVAVAFRKTSFTGTTVAGFYPNLVSILSTVSGSSRILFDGCGFSSGGNALVVGGSVSSLRVTNSVFDTLSNTAIILNACDGFTSIGNYYGNITTSIARGTFNDAVNLGDYYYNKNSGISSNPATGINLGRLRLTDSSTATLSATPTTIPITGNIAAKLNYDISNTSSKRYGSVTFNVNGTTSFSSFNDEYTETSVGFGANVYVTPTNVIFSVNSGVATLKYNYEIFEN